MDRSFRLELQGVGRVYTKSRGPAALAGVTLDIGQGEFVAIEGPSGGGKSTILNVIGLLDRADSGTYRIGGEDVAELGERSITRLRASTFSYVFQSFHLLDARPVRDSVGLGLLYQGKERSAREARIKDALERVGLADRAEQLASTLSGGERQRVALARALASGTPVLLADEPTGNLDQASGNAVMDILANLAETGTTVVLVTHDPALAARAPRRIRIVDGKIEDDCRSTNAPCDAGQGSEVLRGSPSTLSPVLGTRRRRTARTRKSQVVADAWASIASRRARTLGLAGAVALAVSLALTTVGISESAHAQVTGNFDAAVNRDVTVIDEAPRSAADGTAPVPPTTEALARLSGLSGLEAAAVTSSCGQRAVRLGGERPVYDAPVVIAEGAVADALRGNVSFSGQAFAAPGEGQAFVGRLLADAIGLGPLDGPPVITVDGLSFVVVGVLEQAPRSPDLLGSVLIANDPRLTCLVESRTWWVRTLPGAARQVGGQVAVATDPVDPSRLRVIVPADPETLRGAVEGSVKATLTALTFVALLVAVGALMNAMNMAVGERHRELGLRRAVGAGRADLAALVALESLMIGVIGGVAGLVFGLGSILGVTVAFRWVPVFDLSLAPVAVAIGAILGVAGSVGASVRAARVRPHEALRS